MDPEQITQIFCPHCRRGVAIRGSVPNESECPHCEKSFSTAEYASPNPTHGRNFTSSTPPTHLRNDSPSLDERVYRTLSPLSTKLPAAIIWAAALLAGSLAPLLDGPASAMGTMTTYSTLLFLYLFWLRSFGTRSAQGAPSIIFNKLRSDWKKVSELNTSRRWSLASLSFLVGACFFLALPNLFGLSELSLRSWVELSPLLQFNRNLREIGYFCLCLSTLFWIAARLFGASAPAN